MRKRDLVVAILAGGAMLPAADWLTDGGNQYRNGWQKDEKILTKANVSGMKPLWKIKLENEVRELHALFPPLIIGALNVSGATREVAIVTGITELTFDYFAKTAGLTLTKVPYRDIVQAATDVGEGRLQIMMASYAILQPQAQAGRIKILAVNGRQRAQNAAIAEAIGLKPK